MTSDSMFLQHGSDRYLQRTCQSSGFILLFEKTNYPERYSDLMVRSFGRDFA